MMKHWHDFLDSLDSDGGHIFLLLMLMGVGMIGLRFNVAKAEDILTGAFGALLMSLKNAGSNKDRRDSQTITETATVTATPIDTKQQS